MKYCFKFLILIFFCTAGKAQEVTYKQMDSVLKTCHSNKERKILKKQFDNVIASSLSGNWLYHGGVMQFQGKRMSFTVRDTLRAIYNWQVKDGVFSMENSNLLGNSGLELIKKTNYLVLYSSATKLEFIPVGENDLNHLRTAQKIKD